MSIKLVKPKKVYTDTGRPKAEDAFPFTEKYFHKAGADQGVDFSRLSPEEIELACLLYAEGFRREHQDTDLYEIYRDYEDFVHEDELHGMLRKGEREYEPDFNDGDCRFSFSYVPNKY